MMRDFVISRILRRVANELELDPAEAALRANLLATQMVGLIMVRYIVRFEPLASLEPETVVALLAPTLQHYLTGPMPAGAVPATPPPARRRAAPAGPATTLPPRVPGAEPSRRRGRA